LAKNKTPAAKKPADQPTITRITATDTDKKGDAAPSQKPESAKKRTPGNPLAAFGGYFKGAWYELRQVRWPNRKATWSLTAAVIAFTAAFTLLILLLDALFKYIFQLILGS
jgi:preprotein translocase SecE subunit